MDSGLKLAGTRPSVLAVRAREAPLVLGMDVGAVMGAAGDAEDRADEGEEAEVLEDAMETDDEAGVVEMDADEIVYEHMGFLGGAG